MRAPDVTVGAAPRGFRDRLVEAMDAEVITGATEAIEEPTDRAQKKTMGSHADSSITTQKDGNRVPAPLVQ